MMKSADTPVTLRRAAAADFDSVLAVINDGAMAYKDQIPKDSWKEPYMDAEELGGEISEAGIVFWLAETAERQVVAVMGVQQRNVNVAPAEDVAPNVTLIRHAYTRTAWQRRGIGAQLLRHLLQREPERPVLIGTWSANDVAIGFYQHNGFQLIADSERKSELLRKYWFSADLGASNDPETSEYRRKQIDASVVLADEAFCSGRRPR